MSLLIELNRWCEHLLLCVKCELATYMKCWRIEGVSGSKGLHDGCSLVRTPICLHIIYIVVNSFYILLIPGHAAVDKTFRWSSSAAERAFRSNRVHNVRNCLCKHRRIQLYPLVVSSKGRGAVLGYCQIHLLPFPGNPLYHKWCACPDVRLSGIRSWGVEFYI